MKTRIITAATLALGLAGPAAAQNAAVSGVYVGAGVGATLLNETINRRSPTGFFGQGNGASFSYNTGFTASGALGWGFGNGVRVELEGYVRRPGLQNVTLFGNGSFSGGLVSRNGTAQIYGFMANVYYDPDLSALGSFFRYVQPYIGAGLGFAYTEFNNINVDAFGSLRTSLSGTGRTLGYQLIAGAAVPLDDFVPGLALTAEYRYFGAGAPKLQVTTSTIPNNNQPSFRLANLDRNVSPNIGSHNVTVGFRYAFNTPQSVPVAAPVALGFAFGQPGPQPASRNYAVFFPLSNTALDSAARGTVTQAVQMARSSGASGLDVVGSADGAPNANNRALAQRRAQIVVAELVRQGVPRSAISVSAVGGTGPTDPQSRRVDITLR